MNLVKTLCLASFLTLPLAAQAENSAVSAGADKPIFVVDIQKVIDQSKAGRAARAKIEEEAKVREGRILELKKEAEMLRADFEKQKALLSPEALSEKEAQVRSKDKELARTFQDQDEELTRKNSVEIERIVRRIDRGVAEMMKSEKYSLVMEKAGALIVYTDPRYDMTQKVISVLDSEEE